jgi:hypothetical protein
MCSFGILKMLALSISNVFTRILIPITFVSYLGNLMRSTWIMDKLLACDEFKNVPPGSLCDDGCVREMNRVGHNPHSFLRIIASDCSVLDPTSREWIPFPDITTVLQLPEKDFQIWITDPEADKLDDEALEACADRSVSGIIS